MAGHKGYGFALLVEILAAVLSGAGVTHEVKSWMLDDCSQPTRHGHAFLAVNVGAMMPPNEFAARTDRLIRKTREAPKAKGSARIYLPGEMEWEKRDAALQHGMALPPDVISFLHGLADDWQLPPAFLDPRP
jgi:LDH2 family malate/lactate/ureidoglycolate dehydrogenase